MFAPYWVSYPELIKMAGAKPVFVPTVEEEGFAIDFTALENAVTEHTKAIILNSPSNPSGAVLSEKEVRTIAALAIKKDFIIISDEIYDALVYDGAKHFSPASIPEARDRVILINGMSKAYAMTGWRMGYSISNPTIA